MNAWRCRWCGKVVGTKREPAWQMAGLGGAFCRDCVDFYHKGETDTSEPGSGEAPLFEKRAKAIPRRSHENAQNQCG